MNTSVIAGHRFNNDVRYRTNKHPNQRQLTPGYVLAPVRQALGGEIELDPCTEPDNLTGAQRFYTEADDGLTSPWNVGTIYCNPPYGRLVSPGSSCASPRADAARRLSSPHPLTHRYPCRAELFPHGHLGSVHQGGSNSGFCVTTAARSRLTPVGAVRMERRSVTRLR